METKKSERDTFIAADVVLLIIKNEGELTDDIEYPAEFVNAYAMLQNFDIIKSEKGKFTSAVNFDSASNMGVQKYVERQLAKNEGIVNQSRKRRKLNLAVLTASVAMVGYFIRKVKIRR